MAARREEGKPVGQVQVPWEHRPDWVAPWSEQALAEAVQQQSAASMARRSGATGSMRASEPMTNNPRSFTGTK